MHDTFGWHFTGSFHGSIRLSDIQAARKHPQSNRMFKQQISVRQATVIG